MKTLLKRWDLSEESSIWKKATFVFDSSSLLNFYEFSEMARQDIYKNIFPKLQGRLWITNQNEYEILKHRNKLINKPEQLYAEIKENYYPTKHLKDFIKQYDQLKSHTAKDTKHPYFSPQVFEKFDNSLAELKKDAEEMEKILESEASKQLDEHKKVMANDHLLSFFQVTPGYKYYELMNIVEEGEFRYRNKIPPGYADDKTKEAFGLAKFADLIIWKQMLALAVQLNLPIILVTDDVKEDWCLTDKNDKRKMLGPRIELIKEMLDNGGVEFWSYNTLQFLHKANEILKSEVAADVIEEVQKVAENRGTLVKKLCTDGQRKNSMLITPIGIVSSGMKIQVRILFKCLMEYFFLYRLNISPVEYE